MMRLGDSKTPSASPFIESIKKHDDIPFIEVSTKSSAMNAYKKDTKKNISITNINTISRRDTSATPKKGRDKIAASLTKGINTVAVSSSKVVNTESSASDKVELPVSAKDLVAAARRLSSPITFHLSAPQQVRSVQLDPEDEPEKESEFASKESGLGKDNNELESILSNDLEMGSANKCSHRSSLRKIVTQKSYISQIRIHLGSSELMTAPFAIKQVKVSTSDMEWHYNAEITNNILNAEHSSNHTEANVVTDKMNENSPAEDRKDEEQCNACKRLVSLKDKIIARCGHAFHITCIEDSKFCPVCGEVAENTFSLNSN